MSMNLQLTLLHALLDRRLPVPAVPVAGLSGDTGHTHSPRPRRTVLERRLAYRGKRTGKVITWMNCMTKKRPGFAQ